MVADLILFYPTAVCTGSVSILHFLPCMLLKKTNKKKHKNIQLEELLFWRDKWSWSFDGQNGHHGRGAVTHRDSWWCVCVLCVLPAPLGPLELWQVQFVRGGSDRGQWTGCHWSLSQGVRHTSMSQPCYAMTWRSYWLQYVVCAACAVLHCNYVNAILTNLILV